MQGFLLGLSSGFSCVTACAPTLAPYLLGEGRSIRQNVLILGKFLGGRLCGYLLFAILAWAANHYIFQQMKGYELIVGVSYIVLAILLARYGLLSKPVGCDAACRRTGTPHFLGFVNGLNLCPPFLLAVASVGEMQTLGESVWFFFCFFLGTLPYFVPFPLLGFFRTLPYLRIIGRQVALLVSVYYLIAGLMMLAGGLGSL